MTAAKHRLLDRMRHALMAAREQQALGDEADARAAHLAPDPLDLLLADEADEVGDDALRLMFIACHPKLAREAQWALTLRLVAGLTVAEIARALFTKEANGSFREASSNGNPARSGRSVILQSRHLYGHFMPKPARLLMHGGRST